MKKSSLLLLSFSLTMGMIAQAEALALRIGVPGIVFSNQQPIPIVIVNSHGDSYDQTVYYDPSLGGIDLNASWAGPNASIYIPSLGTGYVWYNGYWVDQDGYYWNGDQRIFINVPNWHDHWAGYWHSHPHDNWRRDGWHDRDHRDRNERDHDRGDNRPGRDFDKNQGRGEVRTQDFQNRQRFEEQRRDVQRDDRGQNRGPADRGTRGDERGPGRR